MCVIQPDLLAGVEWIVWDAHNDRGFPICQACEIARIGGDDWCDIDVCSGEKVYALMGMTASHLIAPQETHKAPWWEKKRGRPTLGFGKLLPVRVGCRALHPLAELV